jgi:hypothetical protein
MDDDERLWLPPDDGVPPIVGRRDPGTNEPLMHYDTAGEISLPAELPAEIRPAVHYKTDDGSDVSISF